jgi:hypothetical protein
MGDQERGEVLGAGADVPHGLLDALGVCGVPGVDQGRRPTLPEQVPVHLAAADEEDTVRNFTDVLSGHD